MAAKKNQFKPAMATSNDYEQDQRICKDMVIKASDADLLVRCKCGQFCDQVPERNSVVLYCATCGNEAEFPYLSFKNINRHPDFQAQFINNHDSKATWRAATGRIHSSDKPITA